MKRQSLTALQILILLAVLLIATTDIGTVAEETALQIDKLDHVALNVKDLQRSLDWYQNTLGFEVLHKWNTTWMIRRGDMKIGLFLRPSATSVGDTDNKLSITHFAFSTTAAGFVDAQMRLKKLGIKFEPNPPEDTGIAYSIFLTDPDGYQVEITTYH